jgi:hypothetical protein
MESLLEKGEIKKKVGSKSRGFLGGLGWGWAVALNNAFKGQHRTLQRSRRLQKTRLVMQAQYERVDFKGHLLFVGLRQQVTFIARLHDGAVKSTQPGLYR